MKIQINLTAKTITIEETVNLGEFFIAIEKLFPDGDWKEYELVQMQISNWFQPINVPLNPTPAYPTFPPRTPITPHEPWIPNTPFWLQPIVTCKLESNYSVYNVNTMS